MGWSIESLQQEHEKTSVGSGYGGSGGSSRTSSISQPDLVEQTRFPNFSPLFSSEGSAATAALEKSEPNCVKEFLGADSEFQMAGYPINETLDLHLDLNCF
jgi:hypothetical protein